MQPYIEFKTADIVPISLTRVAISWSLGLTSAPLDNYRFRVLRSEGGTKGPFDIVADGLPVNTKSWVDASVALESKLKSFIWWVEIYDTTGPFVRRSQALTPSELYDKIALTIIDKAYLILSNKAKGVGIECVLHSLKSWGERCPVCWDPIKSKIKISNCPDCYGSGFKSGYFNPVKLWLAVDPGQSGVQMADITAIEQVRHNAWTVAAPVIEVNDVITFLRTNERYRVVSQNFSVKRGAVLRQFVGLSQLSRHSIEYKLPVE